MSISPWIVHSRSSEIIMSGDDAKYDVLFERVSEMRQLCVKHHEVESGMLVKTLNNLLRQVRSCDSQWCAYLATRAEREATTAGDHVLPSPSAPRSSSSKTGYEHEHRRAPSARRVAFDDTEYLWEFPPVESSYAPCAYPTLPDAESNFAKEHGRCAWIQEHGVGGGDGGAEGEREVGRQAREKEAKIQQRPRVIEPRLSLSARRQATSDDIHLPRDAQCDPLNPSP